MKYSEKIVKEAEQYKELSVRELKKTIRNYKSLSNSASPRFYFLFTLTCTVVTYFVFFNQNIFTFLMLLLFHYGFMWKFLYEHKKFHLVSDEDKEEIDQVVEILEEYLKNKK